MANQTMLEKMLDMRSRDYDEALAKIEQLEASLTAAQQRIQELEQECARLRDDRDLEKRWRKDSDDRAATLEETLAEREQELDDVRRDRMGSARASRPEGT